MSARRSFWAVFWGIQIFGGVLAAAPLPGEEPAALKAGFGEGDITPQVGMEQPGGYGKSYHRTLHDPCKVRAAVFDDGRRRVAVVGVDALALRRETVDEVRKAITAKTGIPAEAILLAASHSHSSGPIFGVWPGEFDLASKLVQKLAYEQSTVVNVQYEALVRKQIVTAVYQADTSRVKARLAVGKGLEGQVSFNRRFHMNSGLSFTHPGQGNADTLEPAGPIDPEVGVIGAWDEQGHLLGCVVNFACHATTSPGGISANYIYYLEQAIRGVMGQKATVVFLAGASGDVTQVDNLSPYARPDAEGWARLVGGRVGAEALKVLVSMRPGTLVPVDARSRLLQIPRRRPSPERVQRCLEIVQKDAKQVDATQRTFAKEILLLDALLAKRPAAELEVQAIQIGPVVLLANPAEWFCQFGLEMKAQSPFPFTFPVTLANGCVGYVPTEEAFGPHGGGYETRLTSYSNLETTAGNKMLAAALELAGQMKPGTLPAPPKAPPFKSPWSYGNVPPERE
jgi:hypothetical protein